MNEFDPAILAYISEVAETLNQKQLESRDAEYGTSHIVKITFGFNGEEDPRAVITQGEHGKLVVSFVVDTPQQ